MVIKKKWLAIDNELSKSSFWWNWGESECWINKPKSISYEKKRVQQPLTTANVFAPTQIHPYLYRHIKNEHYPLQLHIALIKRNHLLATPKCFDLKSVLHFSAPTTKRNQCCVYIYIYTYVNAIRNVRAQP